MYIDQHWLLETERIPSPNFDDRPDPADISLIVIHCISLPPGQWGAHYINRLFLNELNPDEHPYFKEIFQLKVSAHVLVQRDGKVIQYVPFDKRAWHAGQSSYEGRERCNDFSIGIELEGTDDSAFTDAQYDSLCQLATLLFAHYPKLGKQRITGHSDIAPGRKTDPGPGFCWPRLFNLLDGLPHGAPRQCRTTPQSTE